MSRLPAGSIMILLGTASTSIPRTSTPSGTTDDVHLAHPYISSRSHASLSRHHHNPPSIPIHNARAYIAASMPMYCSLAYAAVR
ncbi:hypothetical protein C8R43DRAFT_73821 [Mycena crocata]|nr:hypothetical protein C8R43DRAFT_73821 [Mycena crocata]